MSKIESWFPSPIYYIENIISEKVQTLGKIKYDDKILHRSKVVKIFTENQPNKEKINKDFLSIYKKVKYFP